MDGAGCFISFEGIDGAGKSTHIAPLAENLREQGIDVVVTREPGGTPLAEKLRTLILHEDMDPMTETLLAFAARKDHIEKVIRPALHQGKVVLCDRFTDSTVAYQGFGKGFQNSQQVISLLEKWVQGSGELSAPLLQPDLTFWFDLDPVVAAQRMSGRSATDRFDSQQADFFERVRLGYVIRSADPRVFRIDADRGLTEVWDEVCSVANTFVWSGEISESRNFENLQA